MRMKECKALAAPVKSAPRRNPVHPKMAYGEKYGKNTG